jgi:hypothetical protein
VRYSSNKDLDKKVKELIRHGWTAEFGRHLKLRSPDGKLITCSLSPSCPHAHRNLARDIRKYIRKGA